LCVAAGSLNAGGFLLLGGFMSSHVTGNWTRTGLELGRGDTLLALQFLAVCASFIAGAMVATFVIENHMEDSRRVRYLRPLVLEIVLLGLIGLVGPRLDTPAHSWNGLLVALFAFTMGLQNATITKVSGTVMRTTHMTGASTDLGIELARVLLLVRDEIRTRLRGEKPLVHPEMGFARTILAESARAMALSCLIGGFALGGVLGAVTFGRWGYLGVIPICFILLGVVAVSYRRMRREVAGKLPAQTPSRRIPRSTLIVPPSPVVEVPPPQPSSVESKEP
jgi:uncharacterized membrane protein YoaK (UPF0700 family)